ncbi:unnamed protein product [Adineta ricciae]|uniref:Dynein axonemal light chain 1 n=1 Tax=Adineta ricciae TaxID=249248 RepID=A0A814Q9P2_ADIRI|nr:unnamed protein product [Adineta ricciae]CAF1397517.1 unnamed protein product [Adineta ricciae]
MAVRNQTRSVPALRRESANNEVHPISASEAIARWEKQTGQSAHQAKEIMLNGYYPPINVMDASIEKLLHCEKLSLSTNMIEKIAHLNGLRKSKNFIVWRVFRKSSIKKEDSSNRHSLQQEVLNETLEELWISYNSIQKFDGILNMKKLRVLYISNNQIKDWSEIRHLASVDTLEDLVLYGNPIHDEWKKDEDAWIETVHKLLKSLKKLDGLFLKQDFDN